MGIMREFDGESAHASTRFGIWMAALDSSDGYAQPAISVTGPDDCAFRKVNSDVPEMIEVALAGRCLSFGHCSLVCDACSDPVPAVELEILARRHQIGVVQNVTNERA